MIIKPIPNYEGIYSVTDSGDVLSAPRPTTAGGKLKQHLDSHGYYTVSLCKNGKAKRFKVHRLVAEAFIGVATHGLCVDHIDNDRTNNNHTNLRYVTYRENAVFGKRSALNKNKTSKYVGVFRFRGKWGASKYFSGIQYNLGVFDSEDDAYYAYESMTESDCKQQRVDREKGKTSQIVGVSFDKSKKAKCWCAKIKGKFIGNFYTEQEAADAIAKL